jgi:hypothetical protein
MAHSQLNRVAALGTATMAVLERENIRCREPSRRRLWTWWIPLSSTTLEEVQGPRGR